MRPPKPSARAVREAYRVLALDYAHSQEYPRKWKDRVEAAWELFNEDDEAANTLYEGVLDALEKEVDKT